MIVLTFAAGMLQACSESTNVDVPRRLGVLHGHTEIVFSVKFSGDGGTLASVDEGQTIWLWDVRTNKALGAPLADASSGLDAIAFSPRGHTLAYSQNNNRIRLLDVRANKQIGALLRGHRETVSNVAFSVRGNLLASHDESTIRLWDLRTHRQIGPPLLPRPRDVDADVDAVALSPDGRILASAHDFDHTIRLWDTHTHRQIGRPLTNHTFAGVVKLEFSADGRTFLSVGVDGPTRLWDVRTRTQLGAAVADDLQAAALSPDGRTVAYADGRAIRLIDVRTREQIGPPLTGHTDDVFGVTFSPDGRMLASGTGDGTVWLWDLNTSSARTDR
ncbi:MAG: WD40 repeat domain-containing protein [Actinobacteria bacterium]|nr:WD40 repeat domain-containing protein [Actinomycetota bacterium]